MTIKLIIITMLLIGNGSGGIEIKEERFGYTKISQCEWAKKLFIQQFEAFKASEDHKIAYIECLAEGDM